MPSKQRKPRIPTLKYTKSRNIGWHVSFRDPKSGTPKKHRFGMICLKEAEKAYHEWVAVHLGGEVAKKKQQLPKKLGLESVAGNSGQKGVKAAIVPGSLLNITSGFLRYEESRVRKEGEARRQGTISRSLYQQRKLHAQEILEFLNLRHGDGAVRRMMLCDLELADVEAYNEEIVEAGYSATQVNKRVQLFKAIIDRAGRPEHDGQVLGWNWQSRDVRHGKPVQKRQFPSLKQLQTVLRGSDPRETAMAWMAIGCGFGQRDLAAIRVGQFDKKSYDMRRVKTGVERFGDTPPLVWKVIQKYLQETKREKGELLFITAKGMPVVHGKTDAVAQWWKKVRRLHGKVCKDMCGFYTLRHLGATEFGSRAGCSIGEMKRWLGHSASSAIADVYMKPVSPEKRQLVEWVRKSLRSGRVNLREG